MRFRCYNPKCGHPPKHYEFESDVPRCPKCQMTGAPAVHALCDVHFLVMGQGPLSGSQGPHYVACEPERPHLALYSGHDYSATDVPVAVTCPRCQGTREFQEMTKALFPGLWAEMQARKSGAPVTVDLKPPDCGCGK